MIVKNGMTQQSQLALELSSMHHINASTVVTRAIASEQDRIGCNTVGDDHAHGIESREHSGSVDTRHAAASLFGGTNNKVYFTAMAPTADTAHIHTHTRTARI